MAGTFKQSIPSSAIDMDNLKLTYPPAPVIAGEYAPNISKLEFDPDTYKLTLEGDFLPPDSYASSFDFKVWLEPRGDQIAESTDPNAETDRGLVWKALTPSSVMIIKSRSPLIQRSPYHNTMYISNVRSNTLKMVSKKQVLITVLAHWLPHGVLNRIVIRL